MTRTGRLTVVGLVAVLSLCVAMLVAVIQAQAQTQGLVPQQVPYNENQERHCVASAVKAGSAGGSQMECFKTFREAVYVATGGRIKDAPNDASEVAKNGAFRARLFASPKQQSGNVSSQSVCCNDTSGSGAVLSVEYEDAYYRGNTLTYRGGSGCDYDSGYEWGSSYVGSRWNDEISSYVGANRCQVRHYQHSNYGGDYTYISGADDYMGVFNDETSSIRWY